MSPKAAWASSATLKTSISARPQRRAGDEVDVLALAQAHGLEQLPAGLGLLDGVGGERVADGVADALGQQRGDAGGGLDEPTGRRAGLGDAEVERVVDLVGQQPVGLDHQRHRRRLDRDLDVLEADLLEVADLDLGRLDHGLGRDLAAVLLVELGVERAAVDADADGHAPVLGLGGHGLDVLGLADVARVEPQAVRRRPRARRAPACTGGGCRRRSAPASGGRCGPGPRRPRARCRCSARCRSRRRPGRRSAASVPSTSAVLVIVIDCTVIGAPPPTGTSPTMIWRVVRRG